MKPDCSCKSCVAACTHEPGFLDREDMPRIAEFLGITQHRLRSSFLHRFGNAYALRGDGLRRDVRVGDGGNPLYPGRGRCVFLTNEARCAIHPVKPRECRDQDHTTTGYEANASRYLAIASWGGDAAARVWADIDAGAYQGYDGPARYDVLDKLDAVIKNEKSSVREMLRAAVAALHAFMPED